MVYVSSDWHGVPYETIQKLFDKAGFGDDDFLFVLGDIIDRGEHGVELIKKIMFAPNIKLLRGNHEEMLLSCKFLFDEVTKETLDDFNYNKMSNFHTWQYNGGTPTIEELRKETPEMRQMILEFIEDTPFYDSVSIGDKDFLLVHGGLPIDENGKILKLSECMPYDLIWTRPHILTEYSHDFMTIIGHTPTGYYGREYRGRIFKTDTWIDIDTGAASGLSPCLLRLDDMQEFYIDN